MSSKALFGIDLGGTKTEGIVLGSQNPKTVLCRQRVPTEQEKGYEYIILNIKKLLLNLEGESGTKAQSLGICTPGTSDPSTGLHKNSNTTCLNGKPFLGDLSEILKIPVYMANDANCFALAEATLGVIREKAPQAKEVFGIIMGTGVGGGLVTDGRVINGRHGIGGEWGHNFLDESGGPCYCGKTGCVETVISGPALEAFYEKLSGRKLPLREIIILSEKGSDPHAKATADRLSHFFGRAVAVLINILDPEAVVIGGGVGNIDLLYTKGRKEVEKYIFNPVLETLFLKPTLGDSAGVFGAAMLNPY
jgi:predicted NBD/HSP70 family sugar kinase